MKKQRILSALLALCIVFSLVPTALAEKADDFSLGIRGIYHRKFALLHADLKKAEQCLPHRTIIVLTDSSRTIHLQHRTLTKQSDVVR